MHKKLTKLRTKNFNTPKQKYYQKILNATANRKQNPVISKASFSCALEIL